MAGKGSKRPITNAERLAKQEHKREQIAIEAYELTGELNTPEGHKLFGLIESTLEARIDQMVEQDPECRGLLTVLRTVNHTINFGDKYVKDILTKAGKL